MSKTPKWTKPPTISYPKRRKRRKRPRQSARLTEQQRRYRKYVRRSSWAKKTVRRTGKGGKPRVRTR